MNKLLWFLLALSVNAYAFDPTDIEDAVKTKQFLCVMENSPEPYICIESVKNGETYLTYALPSNSGDKPFTIVRVYVKTDGMFLTLYDKDGI